MNSCRTKFQKVHVKNDFTATIVSGSWKIALELQFHLSHPKEFKNWPPAILVLQHAVSEMPQHKL